jgi:hypothetical protein
MTFSTKLKSFVDELIDRGEYVIRDNELVFVIDPTSDDRYIYSAGKKWRVIIPHADNPKKKISVGYYTSKSEARSMRNAYLRTEMEKWGQKVFDRALKGSSKGSDSVEESDQLSDPLLEQLRDRYSPIRKDS